MTSTRNPARPTIDPPAPWRFPSVQRSDGVLRCPLPGRPLTAASLVLHAPLAGEPADRHGVALTALHALFTAAPDADGTVLHDRLQEWGVTVNLSADHDGLRIDLVGAAERIDRALALLWETFAAPPFDPTLTSRVLDQRRSAVRSRFADPRWRAAAELRRSCVDPASRWADPPEGTPASMVAVDADDVTMMARRLCSQVPPSVVIAGEITDLHPAAPGGRGAPSPATAVLRTPGTPTGVVVHRPAAVQACLAVGGAGVDRADDRWADLQVAACVLGGAMWSRLSARLREDKGYTYGVSAAFRPWRRSGLFSISTAVDAAVAEPAIADLLTTVREFTEHGMTAAEHRRATDYLLHSGPLQFQTSAAVVDRLADLERAGVAPDHTDDVRERWRSGTAEAAGAAFRSVVDPDALTVVATGDAQVVVPALKAAGVNTVEVTE